MRPAGTRLVVGPPIRKGQLVSFMAAGCRRIGHVESLDETSTQVTIRTPDGERHAVHLWRVQTDTAA